MYTPESQVLFISLCTHPNIHSAAEDLHMYVYMRVNQTKYKINKSSKGHSDGICLGRA